MVSPSQTASKRESPQVPSPGSLLVYQVVHHSRFHRFFLALKVVQHVDCLQLRLQALVKDSLVDV